MQQAARVSDRTAFFTAEVNSESDRRTGVLVEYDRTEKIFSNPATSGRRTTSPAGSGERACEPTYHQELDEIRNQIVRLAGSVIEAIPRATRSSSTATSRAPTT